MGPGLPEGAETVRKDTEKPSFFVRLATVILFRGFWVISSLSTVQICRLAALLASYVRFFISTSMDRQTPVHCSPV